MSWIYTHNNPYYPRDNRPLIRAWDLETGRAGLAAGLLATWARAATTAACACWTARCTTRRSSATPRRGAASPAPRGLTAALDPATGKVLWQTTEYYVTAGCTIPGKDGRLYLGGYNQPQRSHQDRYVWCLDARDGSLVWQSEPVASAVNVVTVGEKYLFSNASGKDGHVLDKATGKIVSRFNFGYACTRFTMSDPYVMGANMDMIDLSAGQSAGHHRAGIDSRECVGSIVSNGRLFYTSQASGLQVSQLYGEEAERRNCRGMAIRSSRRTPRPLVENTYDGLFMPSRRPRRADVPIIAGERCRDRPMTVPTHFARHCRMYSAVRRASGSGPAHSRTPRPRSNPRSGSRGGPGKSG